METTVKLEAEEAEEAKPLELPDRPLLLASTPHLAGIVPVIDLSSSGSDSETEAGKGHRQSDGAAKKRKLETVNLPPGFLDPLPSPAGMSMRLASLSQAGLSRSPAHNQRSRQFWKAGDFEGLALVDDRVQFSSGMDHVRVHPKFLHSNATSHKWVLGAFAELLDNSLDEVCNGATFVSIDVLDNKKDGTKMLQIEDNGGGMSPEKMRKCMSLGYSAKSKIANCIGQYGNGFKTSTMRLGADVIVFSCSLGEGKSPTKSIGMLSYSFLRDTGKEDIVVPMLDYEKRGQKWEKMSSSSLVDWNKNVDSIVHWSPYFSEADLLLQFDLMPDHGTRIIIYNLWEDDLGKLELDFDTDKHDIQISGVNRDEKKIQMANKFPNSKHFLTYRHSLRSYASIIYLRLPNDFKMILRGKEIAHHNIVNDMMLKQEVTYRPQPGTDGVPKDPSLVAVVTIGFVKDAKHHIDVQGFNVYHKNRLIKPFWRVWNAAGSDGRGVIGVLEANFVEPAHDKQGFERTTVLSRLEARLIQMQKTYWTKNCHKVGYAPRGNINNLESTDKESSPEVHDMQFPQHPKRGAFSNKVSKAPSKYQYSGKPLSSVRSKGKDVAPPLSNKAATTSSMENGTNCSKKQVKRKGSHLYEHSESDSESEKLCSKGDNSVLSVPNAFSTGRLTDKERNLSELMTTSPCSLKSNGGGIDGISTRSQAKAAFKSVRESVQSSGAPLLMIKQLEDENDALKQSLKTFQESMSQELQQEKCKNKLLLDQLEEKQKLLDEANKEQEALIDIFSEERTRRDEEEATLRKKLKNAQDEIHELLDKLARTTR